MCFCHGQILANHAVKSAGNLVRLLHNSVHLSNPHFGKSYAVNLNHAHEELQDLIERVTIELELQNVVQERET